MYDSRADRQFGTGDGETRVIQVDIEGSGPPLVLVHSLLTDSAAFDLVAPTLALQRTIVRVSLPGFGTTSPLDTPNPTIFELAEVVAEALDLADVSTDATVLGNGFGAFVVVALAISHGERFGDLIVANGGAAFSPERQVAFTTMSNLVSDGGMEAVVDVAVRRIFTDAYLEMHPEVIDERRAVLVQTDPAAFAASCRALRDMDLREQAGLITNRTLVVAGGADGTTPPEMSQDLASRIPGAEYVELADCGHCPPLEKPDLFIQEVERFLRAK